MRNLIVNSAITTKNDAAILNELQGTLKICIDTLNEIIYFVTGSYKIVAVNRLKKIANIIEIPKEIGIIDDEDSNNLLRFDFHSEDQRLCLIFEQGQILIVHIEEKRVEKVFDLGKRITGCSWSPDLQLLVIASENQLYIVSRVLNHQDGHQFFKILTETIQRPTSSGKDQLVTIGWGTAETQFQGSAGKQNREKKNPNKIPIPIRNEFDDKRVLISWRADGQYFTVSTVDEILIPKQESPSKNIVVEKMHCRQLRVWNRDLELMSHCEFLSGMEAALCMRPSGNLVAVPRIIENERFIWFFERNGQYRNKFKLQNPPEINDLSSQTVVNYISWNLDSTILVMLFCNKKDGINQFQFWTVSNYSWAEKLRLNVEEGLVDHFWDSESMNKFHYVTADGNYNQILLQFEYNCNEILALSINGGNIRVTDFRMATIPPPLCHTNLQLDYCGTPSAFAFSPKFGLAILGSNYQQMTLFNYNDREFSKWKNFQLENNKLLHNFEWVNKQAIRAVRNGEEPNLMEIVNIDIDNEQICVLQSVNLQIIFAHFIVDSSLKWLDNSFLLEYKIVTANSDENESNKSLLLGQSTMNLAYEQFYQIKKFETGKETLIFTLTNTFLFFVNNKKLHFSIGSFCFSENFLLLLTLDSNLFCIPIQAVLNFLADNLEDTNYLFVSGRQVERGAQLIACEGTKVWLQMPRGNLEVISPRDLVLAELKTHLNATNWETAYLEMRRHRVATDLLYDHNPKVFNENVAEFVKQIDNVDHLNQFLTSLQPHDTTQEMFAAQYPERKDGKQRKSDGKINGICEKIRNVILSIADCEKQKLHLYPVVLTTFIVEKPSRVSAALLNMRDFLGQMNCADSMTQTVQRWLRHMGYMVNEDVLFRQALKTYDMEIALIVAQSTNLDPKEYFPVLNDIRMKTPDLFRNFHIELFLEDWPAALDLIAQLVQEEPENSTYLQKCLEHVTAHNLHHQALRLFCGKAHYKDICKIAAAAMEKQGFMKEAALLYEKTDDYFAAQNCLFSVQDFRGFLRASKLAGQPREKTEPFLKKMVFQLEHRDKFVAAAEILIYLGKEANAEKILDFYSKESAWTKMMEFLNEIGGEFLINKCRVILSIRCMQIIEQIDEWRDNINKHWKRLEQLRVEKAQKLKRIWENPEEEDLCNDGETSSQTSNFSLNSRKTQMSTASSRKKKQNERRKQQIKEGSQWEDAALLVALKGIYTSIYRQQDEMVELLPPLVSLDLVDKGRRLQKEMLDIFEFAWSLIGKIWPDYLEPHHLPGPIIEIYRDKENVVKIPSAGDTMMPSTMHLEDEIQRPKFNSAQHCHWTLNIFQ